MQKRMFKRVAMIIAGLFAVGALTGTAAAVLTADAGGAQVRVDKRTSNLPSVTRSTSFIDLPGANLLVAVPANQSRLYDVPFFAESQCSSPGSGGWCSVRVLATNTTTGASVELNPITGIDYAFDSDAIPGAADDMWEGHGMERSRRLFGGPRGTVYRIRVQYAVTNAAITFRLDDWHLAVHTNL
jgi:hypothetical protein